MDCLRTVGLDPSWYHTARLALHGTKMEALPSLAAQGFLMLPSTGMKDGTRTLLEQPGIYACCPDSWQPQAGAYGPLGSYATWSDGPELGCFVRAIIVTVASTPKRTTSQHQFTIQPGKFMPCGIVIEFAAAQQLEFGTEWATWQPTLEAPFREPLQRMQKVFEAQSFEDIHRLWNTVGEMAQDIEDARTPQCIPQLEIDDAKRVLAELGTVHGPTPAALQAKLLACRPTTGSPLQRA